MRKLFCNNVLLVIIVLGLLTSSVYGILLTRIASLPRQPYHSSVESIQTGELFWESISRHFVTLIGY